MADYQGIYEYIKTEESSFKTTPVPITDGYEWNMYEHIRRSFLYKHSKFWKGKDDGNRPFKNIIRPILNVAYRSEGFDVKDIVPFVNDSKNYYKSFLVKKYHPRWARKYDIDTFIDDLVESYVDYGLALVKNVNNVRPEVVPLTRLAFCDQTDILSGPICEKHYYTPDQLQEMGDKWDKKKIEELIVLATFEKSVGQTGQAKTPGKYVEIYELHGVFPETWLKETGDPDVYTPQMHIVAFYQTENNEKSGITLYKGKEGKPVYKAITRDKIFGRACGFGGVEELFEPQTWTNYSEIQLKEMLDVASLMVLQTGDKTLEGKKLTNLDKGTILRYTETPISQVVIQPYNKGAFDNAVAEWERQAMTMGSATEGSLGKNPSSGTPFALQNLIVQEGKGLHDYRRGKIATFVGELYRDWILEYLVAEMNKGDKWLEELTVEEMQWVAEKIAINEVNKMLLQTIINGEDLIQGETEIVEEIARENFLNSGNKKFLEILKDDLKDIPVDVEVNIVGKQKGLTEITDKLVNIFRTVISAPQILQDKGMADLFNQIIEASGLNPVDFSSFSRQIAQPTQPQATAVATEPLSNLTT